MTNKYCGSGGCFDLSASKRPKDQIEAFFIGANVSLPKIGDSVQVIDYTVPLVPVLVSVTLTASNYVDTLIRWVRYQQISCFGGSKTAYGAFFPKLQAYGTQPLWTEKLSDEGYDEDKGVDSVTNTTTYKIPLGIFNQSFFNRFSSDIAPVSTIDFLDNGAYVLPFGVEYGEYKSRVRNASTPLAGSNINTSAMVDVTHKGNLPPVYYKTASPTTFSAEIGKATEFTFGTPVVTALVPTVCSSKCSAYTIAPTVAFTFGSPVLEAAFADCTTYALYVCGTNGSKTALGALAASISINPSSGIATAPAGLPVGEYTFLISPSNSCCVSGEKCIKISVA